MRRAAEILAQRLRQMEKRAARANQRADLLESTFAARVQEISESFRAVNIAKVIEQSGVDFVTLAERAEQAEAALSALRQSKPQALPDGWKAVPEEPTENMLYEADRAIALPEAYIRQVYAAMLAAAPSPSSEAVADRIISQIEERFPNWKSYRDLIDCIDCTLSDLRRQAR